MRLVLEDIHGNSKVSYLGGWTLQGKQITISPKSYTEGRESFTELYDFFTQKLGPSVDIHTLETLKPRILTAWTYQLDSKYDSHRFFVKDQKDLVLFLLTYGEHLTSWSR
jgi:hypothetical protein